MQGVRINILTEHGTGDDFHRNVNVIDGSYISKRAPQVLEVTNWGITGSFEAYP